MLIGLLTILFTSSLAVVFLCAIIVRIRGSGDPLFTGLYVVSRSRLFVLSGWNLALSFGRATCHSHSLL